MGNVIYVCRLLMRYMQKTDFSPEYPMTEAMDKCKEDLFLREGGQTQYQVAQRGYGVSILGDIERRSWTQP